jgi:D-cysteine desulfhydrase
VSTLAIPLLLCRFPELAVHFPWIPLLPAVPTPVTFLPELGLWVKRDDLACPRYGGNKARKFEWILGELKQKSASGFLTFGGLCSNHCTAAAIYGRAAGLEVTLCFVPTPLTASEYNELLLQAYLGAQQLLVGPQALARLSQPIVPPAGSTVAGVLGYVNAGLELGEQVAQGALPNPDMIYIAAATKGTALGLAMGLALSGLEPTPRVIAIETVTLAWQRARVFLPTPQHALQKLRAHSPEARRRLPTNLHRLACESRLGFDRDPLGVVSAPVQAALNEADALGLTLDAHFSARAWAALHAERAQWQGKSVLFWHTHGLAPAADLAAARASGVCLPPALERAAQRALGREQGGA